MKNKKYISLIIIVFIILVTLFIWNKNNKNATFNEASKNNEITEISYKCQLKNTVTDQGITQQTNEIIIKNNIISNYKVGYTLAYSNEELYNNTIQYLLTQNNNHYQDLDNNTIYYFQEINVDDYFNKIGKDKTDYNNFISFLFDEGYTCELVK
jgi:hypothetical protein